MGHIKFHNVSFRFDSREENSLDDISLQVEPGQTVLLAGRSGSGKSTLLNCLSGLIPEYYPGKLDGFIDLGGDATCWQDVPLWQKAITTGTVFQDPRHQFFSARVEQEIMLSLSAGKATKHDINRQIDILLYQLGLHNFRHRLLDSLSSGEQQRVAIATAISTTPKILILDEPSANLSPDGVDALLLFLWKAREEGTTIVIAEHRFSWLQELIDQLIVLDKGNIIYEGSVEKLNDSIFCSEHGLRLPDTVESTPENHTLQLATRKENTPILSIDQLGFRHNKQHDWLLQHLSYNFHQGGVVALTGKNGCGKTTLLSLLFGLHKPGEGMINYDKNNPSIALALQHPDLQLFSSTVAGEINSPDKKEKKWLERFDLLHLQDRHPLTLSGGEMQRLVLAAAFARIADKSNSILLLDEPTSGMDGYQLWILAGEIEEFCKKGNCVIIATHDSALIKETNATILELGRGRV